METQMNKIKVGRYKAPEGYAYANQQPGYYNQYYKTHVKNIECPNCKQITTNRSLFNHKKSIRCQKITAALNSTNDNIEKIEDTELIDKIEDTENK